MFCNDLLRYYVAMSLDNENPAMALIEAQSLVRKAKSVVPRVAERAIESLHNRIVVAEANNDVECLNIYRKALKDATNA